MLQRLLESSREAARHYLCWEGASGEDDVFARVRHLGSGTEWITGLHGRDWRILRAAGNAHVALRSNQEPALVDLLKDVHSSRPLSVQSSSTDVERK